MSAMNWIETSGERGETPEQLAALERAALSPYPELLEVVDRQTREFASEAAGIGATHDRDALTAKLTARSQDTVASRVPGIVRFLLGTAVLLGPVVAFGLIVVRRAFPLADSIEVGGMLQLVAGGAALVALVALLIDRRPLALGQQVLDGAAVVAILTVVLVAWQTSASPEIAGSNAGLWIVADVVSALAISALNICERTMRSRSRSAFERGTVLMREQLAVHDHELAAAYAMRFDAIARAVDALPLEQRRGMLDDRDAALERLVAAARMRRSAADRVLNLRLGELCLQGALSPRTMARS